MKKAIIYSRVSTDKQDFERQLNDLQQYADQNGYEVVRTFTDVVTGSRKAADRKAAKEMFEYIKTAKIDLVLATEISRLGRSAIDVQNNIHKLVFEMDLDMYIQQQGLRARDNEGKINPVFKLISDVMANVAEMELEQIKERTKSKLRQKQKEYDEYNLANGLTEEDPDFKKLGRPIGTKINDENLLKQHKDIVRHLKNEQSIRNTAKLTGKSTTTIQKVKRAMKATETSDVAA